MFCPNCGTEITENDPKFCPSCGAPIAEGSPQPAAPNTKLIAIIAAAVVLIVVVALVATSCNKPQENTQGTPTADPAPEPEPTPEPEPQDDLTTEEKRAFFVGKWVAQDSTDENMPKSWFDSAAAQGIYITLTLWDDATGVFRTDSGPEKFTWEADSVTTATIDLDGAKLSLVLRSKQLTMKNANGVEMYFVPEDEVDMSNAVDLSVQGQGVTVDPSTIQVDEYSKLIGNESVGYMQVPKGWVNRVDDLDPEFVKSADAVYYVDTTTEYVSPTQGSFAFAQFAQMSRHSASYVNLAQQLVDAYQSDENYGDTSTIQTTIGKRRAICIMSSNLQDNVNVMSIVIDRDNDEKVSVVLSFNCGSIGDEKPTEWALSFASTWQVE